MTTKKTGKKCARMSDEDFEIYQMIRGNVEYLAEKYEGAAHPMRMLIEDCGDGGD